MHGWMGMRYFSRKITVVGKRLDSYFCFNFMRKLMCRYCRFLTRGMNGRTLHRLMLHDWPQTKI